ncbi:MAG: hypothetical protein AAB263_03140, partial [Planctomycetota bacterium]
VLTFAILAAVAQRAHQAQLHQARTQGREWCLGARSLAPGTVIVSEHWRMEIDTSGNVLASGPQGIYRMAVNGDESWNRSP